MFRSTCQNHIRLMVIGEAGVGKSALVVKYLTGRFITEYQSDFDWKYSYETNIDGQPVHMEIIDSLTMDESHIEWAEGFMFVYDVTNMESISRVEQFKKRLDSARSSRSFSMIVVGNKADLEHCRDIKRDKAELVISRLSAACHVDCSACGPEVNVRYAFDELCREVALARQQLTPKRDRRRSSLSTVRQGLKNLVQTGKAKSNSVVGMENGSSSPVGSTNGRTAGRRGSRFSTPSSPYSSLISAPVLNDLPEESDLFLPTDDVDKKLRKSRESSSDSREDAALIRLPVHHHKNIQGAIVL